MQPHEEHDEETDGLDLLARTVLNDLVTLDTAELQPHDQQQQLQLESQDAVEVHQEQQSIEQSQDALEVSALHLLASSAALLSESIDPVLAVHSSQTPTGQSSQPFSWSTATSPDHPPHIAGPHTTNNTEQTTIFENEIFELLASPTASYFDHGSQSTLLGEP